MQKVILLVLAVAAFALSAPAAGGGQMAKEFTIAIPDYSSGQTDRKVLDKQTEAMLKTQRDVVAELTRQLRNKALSNASRVYIVYLLGGFSVDDAGTITVLIENIGLVAKKMDLNTRIRRWGPHPAQDALRRIGNRASQMILQIIGSSKFDPANVNGYATVLVGVERPKYALMKLSDYLAETKDEKVRKQYQMVMARVQMYIRPSR